ncbi:MAG: ferredoxin, partial [Bacteroidales bacterium]
MALVGEDKIKEKTLRRIAEKMLIAARTAPKGRGRDHLVMAIAENKDIEAIAEKMTEIGRRSGANYFTRDAGGILNASVLVLIGTRISSLGLINCGNCGFTNCEAKDEHPEIPCAFNTGDLGIAIGSAVSVAMDHRVDNR